MFEKKNLKEVSVDEKVSELDELTELDLFTLRSQIDQRLPSPKFKDINLEEELVRQYQTAKALQLSVMDSHEEAQKKASVLNACAATLQNLTRMQSEFYKAERFKEIESRLIQALKLVPREHLLEFFAWYESAEMT